MSLLVWYPLQGNTKNYGTLGAALDPAESSVVYTTGILGKSKSTGSLSWTAEQTSKVFHKTTSIAFWIKPTATGSGCIVGNDDMGAATGRRKYCFYQWQTYDSLHYTWQHDDSGDAFFGGTTPITPNQWNHVVGIQSEEGYCAIYVNGELRVKEYHDIKNMNFNYSWPTPIIRNTSINNMCDFRVYDHALSLKEIKELSKALVLHYTFDNSSFENTTNLLSDRVTNFSSSPLGTYSGFSNQMGTGSLIEVRDFQNKRCLYLKGGSDFNDRCYTAKDVAGSTKYTFSCDIYSTSQITLRAEGNGGGYGSGWPEVGKVVYSTPGKWQRVSYTMDVLASPRLYLFFIVPNGVECYINNLQLEEKDHDTPYTSTTRVGIIGDSSGLGNDGQLVLPEYYSFTQDSILGTGALYSAGNSDGTAYIKTKLNPSFIAGTGTICFWYKKNTGSAGFLVATPDPGNQTHYLWANSPGGSPWNGGGASYSHWYIDGVEGKTPVSDTDWHFYCIAGVNVSNWSSFAIQRHGDGSWLYRGKIADFRVYNTVLDSDEIQTMYKARWASNREGQIFSNALNEGQSKFQITKNGVNNCNILSEFSESFELLEYVEATSDRMIDTGVAFDPNVDGVELKYSAAVAQANYFIAGCGSTGLSHPYLWLYHYTGVSGFNAYVSNTSNSQVGIAGYRGMDTNSHIIKYNAKKLYCDGTQTGSTTATLNASMGNLKLFNTATNNAPYATRGKIYYCKVWKNGQLVRNMFPARRVRDNVTGFIDAITGQFFTDNETPLSSVTVRQSRDGSLYCAEFNEI